MTLIAGEDLLKGHAIYFDKQTKLIMVSKTLLDGLIGVVTEGVKKGERVVLYGMYSADLPDCNAVMARELSGRW